MAITPNKNNLKNRADYGVRVARPGYDANNCAQNQLLFNSGWPILQIAEIMDMSSMATDTVKEYKKTTAVMNISTGTLISRTVELSYPDTAPEGYTSSNSYYYDPSENGDAYKSIFVNRKYVKKPIAGTRTSYYYPAESSRDGDITTTITKSYVVYPVAKKTHGLGYVPFFMTSEQISDVSGYLVLFSVDIATDVDYPYTERPLELLNPRTDYGVKSSSKFGSRVPGLCSDMFSKLVQAVKTEETSKGSGGDMRAIWSPVESAEKATGGELLPYEFYSFIGETNSGTGIDGGVYYRRDWPFYISRYTGASLVDAWAVSVASFQDTVSTKNSLVVLRSPMVSPEYEERVL